MAKSATHAVLLISLIASSWAQSDLILTNQNVQLSGYQTYGKVVLTASTITVKPFDGSDYVNSGHLTFNCTSFFMDATSVITARGAGWKTAQCLDGVPTSMGGAGGCSVMDSGGGGGHIGVGGYSTTDCPMINNKNGGGQIQNCTFPKNFEQTCHGSLAAGGQSCADYTGCRTGDGSNPTIGGAVWHSVYDPQLGMGGSGGDKGCRDGDGFGSNPTVGGSGGGRIRIYVSGKMEVYGKITAAGYRGCGNGNDSGGGGAGGTILLEADSLWIRNGTYVEATGGRGGDSQDKDLNVYPECTGTQFGGICDDCGGGGGGGLIYVLANSGNFSSLALTAFNASGANGGSCPGCENEAKGIDGFVEFGHADEVCDGVDNTFDGMIDEDQPMLPCGMPSCVNGIIMECPQPTDNGYPSTTATTRTVSTKKNSPTGTYSVTQSTTGAASTTTQNGGTTGNTNGGNTNNSNGGNTNNGGTTNGSNGGNTNNSNGSNTNGGNTNGGTTNGSNGTGGQTSKGSNGSNQGSAPLEESSAEWVVPSIAALALVAAAL